MSLNQEVFLHNLEAARRKAGSVANLMGALGLGWHKHDVLRLEEKGAEEH
jgi:hypothetical protein